MAYFAKNRDNTEVCFNNRGEKFSPRRDNKQGKWYIMAKRLDEYLCDCGVLLPKGSIKKLIGRDISWVDEPIDWKGGFYD